MRKCSDRESFHRHFNLYYLENGWPHLVGKRDLRREFHFGMESRKRVKHRDFSTSLLTQNPPFRTEHVQLEIICAPMRSLLTVWFWNGALARCV